MFFVIPYLVLNYFIIYTSSFSSCIYRRPALFLLCVVFSFSFIRLLLLTSHHTVHPTAVKPVELHISSSTPEHNITARNQTIGRSRDTPRNPDIVRSQMQRFDTRKQDLDQLSRGIVQHAKSCPAIVRPGASWIKYRNRYWQVLVEDNQELFAGSAFYDDRPLVGLLPFVRIHVVDRISGVMYCQVWYSGRDQPYVTPVIVTSTGRGEKIDEVSYHQNLYSCALPVSYPLPSHISLATDACRNSTMYLPVTTSHRADWQHEFGVCVAIAFGTIATETLVEWIEFHRLMGVTEFNIYDGNLSTNMSGILQYYSDRGVVRVYPMPPPVMDFSKKGVKLSSPASLNDCMLRNMYRYRYMIILDFDELILPVHAHNYTEMLQVIDLAEKLPSSWMSYTFRNVYHFHHFQQDQLQPKYLRTMRYKDRIKPSGYLFAPKSFIDPRTCLSVFNHYCWKRFPSSDKRWTIDVRTDIAMSHHYRDCQFGKDKCDVLSKERQRDDTVMRYKNVLDSRVKTVLDDQGKLKG